MSACTVSLQDGSSLTTGDARESSDEPGLAVVIPCLYEQTTIVEAVADAKAAFASWPAGVEVIVADNGSTDGSVELALAAAGRGPVWCQQSSVAMGRRSRQVSPLHGLRTLFTPTRTSPTTSGRGQSSSQPSSTTTPIAYLKFTPFLLVTATAIGSLGMSIFYAHLLKRA